MVRQRLERPTRRLRQRCSLRIYNLQRELNSITHLGVGGRGMAGSLISGIFMSEGLGGRICGVIPPLARGISVAISAWCLNAFSATIGALNINDGILLILLGLFYANNLSAKLPCFQLLVSFFIAQSTLICRPEKYCPFICEIAKSELLKLS